MRAEGANLSCAQFFNLEAKPQNKQEGVSALESLGNMNPQVWEEVRMCGLQGINLLRHKGPKEQICAQLHSTFRGEGRQHTFESTERSKPERRQTSVDSYKSTCFQLCYGCYFGHRGIMLYY